MKETFRMSREELERVRLMHQVKLKVITLREASQEMGVSERQGKRIWRRFRTGGGASLAHASRGRVSNRRMAPERRREILALYEAHYKGYGPTLASEVLESEHGVVVHRETLRRFLRQACLLPERSQARRHRKQRRRREHFGSMVQIDGSFHEWFEGRGGKSCLMVAIDDATGKSLMWMSEEETTRAAFTILRKWIERYGVPESIYVDRRNVYVTDREATEEEKRRGAGALTDFGRACWKLGIRIIPAHSPEAKGRVERRNGVLQDRLVKTLTRRGISTVDEANAALDELAADLDRRFAREPASPIDRHRKKPLAKDLDEILCWEQTRSVARDWTISYEGRIYQILRQADAPRSGKRVTVRRLMDGTVRVLYEGKRLRVQKTEGAITYQLVTPPPMGGGASSHPLAPSAFP
ncbi:MAG: ISNCY family transposase [Verrucomicrobiaceae bacterium]|nr:ISNCY family transposase [Verrucomicrobiaceae bacterium]